MVAFVAITVLLDFVAAGKAGLRVRPPLDGNVGVERIGTSISGDALGRTALSETAESSARLHWFSRCTGTKTGRCERIPFPSSDHDPGAAQDADPPTV